MLVLILSKANFILLVANWKKGKHFSLTTSYFAVEKKALPGPKSLKLDTLRILKLAF